MADGFDTFAHALERLAGQPLRTPLERATLFGALAAGLLMAPVGNEAMLQAIGRDVAALVWRRVVLDLTEHAPVRQALLHFPSCRYWLRRLAAEAALRDLADGRARRDEDAIWLLWYRVAQEIRAQEGQDA